MIMFAHQARQRLGDIWGVCAISQLFFKHNIFEKGIIIIIIIRWALVMIYKYIYIPKEYSNSCMTHMTQTQKGCWVSKSRGTQSHR